MVINLTSSTYNFYDRWEKFFTEPNLSNTLLSHVFPRCFISKILGNHMNKVTVLRATDCVLTTSTQLSTHLERSAVTQMNSLIFPRKRTSYRGRQRIGSKSNLVRLLGSHNRAQSRIQISPTRTGVYFLPFHIYKKMSPAA